MKSKYLYKFEVSFYSLFTVSDNNKHPYVQIIDIISPKCYVILPKSHSVQSTSPQHVRFVFKQLHTNSVEIFCGTKTPNA